MQHTLRNQCQAVQYRKLSATATGDPIEVGAALAVLQGAQAPLALSAVKSRLGHAEPAAGAIGMLQVLAETHSKMRSPS